jgi:hypothetical protein
MKSLNLYNLENRLLPLALRTEMYTLIQLFT